MNPNRYIMPIMYTNPNTLNFRSMGIMGRLSNGIKSFNWKGLFNGINKTLTTVNQTIPLVRQAKPMYDNVKSMIRLTKVFRNETNNVKQRNIPTNKKIVETNNIKSLPLNNQPVFFI